MLCDVCKINEAIMFVRQISKNKITEFHLCKECGLKKGFTTDKKNEFSLENLLSGVVDSDTDKVCYVCGTSFRYIKENKKVGCAECYNCFEKEITFILHSMGIKDFYTGSMPHKIKYFKSTLTDRILLQQKLDKAIEEEDYEKAALYRDRLKILNKSSIALGDGDEE